MNKIFFFLGLILAGLIYADPVFTWVHDGTSAETPDASPWVNDEMVFIFDSDTPLDSCSFNFTLLGLWTGQFSHAGTLSLGNTRCTYNLPYADHHYFTAYGPRAIGVIGVNTYYNDGTAFTYKSCGHLDGSAIFDEAFYCSGANGFTIINPDTELDCGGTNYYWSATPSFGGAGIYTDQDNTYLHDCIYSGYTRGVELADAQNLRLDNVHAAGAIALEVYRTNNLSIDNGLYVGTLWGILSVNNTNGIIDHSDVALPTGSGVGVSSSGDYNLTIKNGESQGGQANVMVVGSNRMRFNEFALFNATQYNLLIAHSNDTAYQASQINYAPTNVYVYNSTLTSLYSDNIRNSTDMAVWLNYDTNTSIRNSHIHDGAIGVLSTNQSNGLFINNTEIYLFTDKAVYLNSTSPSSEIDNNEIYSSAIGIYDHSQGSYLRVNDIHDNGWGIEKNGGINMMTDRNEIHSNLGGILLTLQAGAELHSDHLYNNALSDFEVNGSNNDIDVNAVNFDSPAGANINHSVVDFTDFSVGATEHYGVKWADVITPYPAPLSFNGKAINFSSIGVGTPHLDAFTYTWTIGEEAGYYVPNIFAAKNSGLGWSTIGFYMGGHQISIDPAQLPTNGQVALFDTIPVGVLLWQNPTPSQGTNATHYPIIANFSSGVTMDSCSFDINIGHGWYTNLGVTGVLSPNGLSCSLSGPQELPYFLHILNPDGQSNYYNITGHAVIVGTTYNTSERDFDYQGCGNLKDSGTYSLGKTPINLSQESLNAPDRTCLNVTANNVKIQLSNTSRHLDMYGQFANGTYCYSSGEDSACANGYGIYAKGVTGLDLSILGPDFIGNNSGALDIHYFNKSSIYLEDVSGKIRWNTGMGTVSDFEPILHLVNTDLVDSDLLINGLGDYTTVKLDGSTITNSMLLLQNAPPELFYMMNATPINTIDLDGSSSISATWRMGLVDVNPSYPFGFTAMYESHSDILVNGPRLINGSNMLVDELVIGGGNNNDFGGFVFQNSSPFKMIENIDVSLADTHTGLTAGNYSGIGLGLTTAQGYGGFGGCLLFLDSTGAYKFLLLNESANPNVSLATPVSGGTGRISGRVQCANETDCTLDCFYTPTGQPTVSLTGSAVIDTDLIPSLSALDFSDNGGPDQARGQVDVFFSNFSVYIEGIDAPIASSYFNPPDGRFNVSTSEAHAGDLTVTTTNQGTRVQIKATGSGDYIADLVTPFIGDLQLIAIDTTYLPEFAVPATLRFYVNGEIPYYPSAGLYKLNGFSTNRTYVLQNGAMVAPFTTFENTIFGNATMGIINVSTFSTYVLGPSANPITNVTVSYVQGDPYSLYILNGGKVNTQDSGWFEARYRELPAVITNPLIFTLLWVLLVLLALLVIYFIYKTFFAG